MMVAVVAVMAAVVVAAVVVVVAEWAAIAPTASRRSCAKFFSGTSRLPC